MGPQSTKVALDDKTTARVAAILKKYGIRKAGRILGFSDLVVEEAASGGLFRPETVTRLIAALDRVDV